MARPDESTGCVFLVGFYLASEAQGRPSVARGPAVPADIDGPIRRRERRLAALG